MIRIIITSAGGKLIPSLTKFLKNDNQLQGLYIVGIDKKKIKKNTYLDKKYLINEIREKNYIIKLLEICKKEKINLVIPYSDYEARVIAKFKNKLTKIGIKVLVNDSKIIKSCQDDLAAITGQKPIITKFKKSISNFKTRKNTNAGLKVTLRKDKMYEFIDRLVNIALPRIKDFRGLSTKGFDKFGNYTFGIREHIIFPEVNFDKVDKIRGLDITIVINSKKREHSIELLNKLNFPFRTERNN